MLILLILILLKLNMAIYLSIKYKFIFPMLSGSVFLYLIDFCFLCGTYFFC
uniref:Uncharacterized protein n=1 Tax=Arsenophonus nasoniae TaxID=638 RepID=D2U4E8_9GAMM|nr:hypothetical protein ARN_35640 [Arsenophonus nasoniae]